MKASRAFLLATGLTLGAAASGRALAQTPGLVVDAGSGRVLFAERATDPWYPASITKLMTVYVALDQVRRGQAAMTTLLTMSETAASQPPSRLGLKPGLTMTLDNALKVIMVKSANDIATMIGENLGGGSVEGFSSHMNEASQRLGMRESRWYNPSGLPDDRQQTSARDMALLARALLLEFPEHEALFRIGAVKLGNTVMRNHNGLLGRYPGADGMKTGFICSGGFSVVASATQKDRKIIAVVMGYPSARERDLRTADLFDNGFSSAGNWGAQHIDSLPPSSSMSAPNMRSVICGPKRRQPQEDDETAVVQASTAGDGNSDNGIARLFAPSAFAAAPSGSAAPGTRRSLGPRVAFEPIPVWIGANPGEIADEGLSKGRRTHLAGRPVRTQRVGRAAAAGPATQAFSSNASTPSIMRGTVETIRSRPSPTSRAALQANLDAQPAAEVKPKPGAVGSGTGERRRLGAIAAKPKPAVEAVNPDTKPAAKAKPKTAQAKPAGATPEPRAAKAAE